MGRPKRTRHPLFEWACAFSLSDQARAAALAYALLSPGKPWRGWLEGKGFPGDYVLEGVVGCAGGLGVGA